MDIRDSVEVRIRRWRFPAFCITGLRAGNLLQGWEVCEVRSKINTKETATRMEV